MLTVERLTRRQKQILDFITDFVSGSSSAPTVREIAEKFGISIGPVQRHLKALIRKGYLKHKPGVSRGIDLVFRKALVAIPVLGRVPAGVPVPPVENVEDYIYLRKDVAKSGNYFALRVKGDSMTGSGILENDLVVVKQQPTAENNDIVIAMVDDEAVVKKLRRKGKGVYLESTNPEYKPISVKQIKILGKVVYLMRNYKTVRVL